MVDINLTAVESDSFAQVVKGLSKDKKQFLYGAIIGMKASDDLSKFLMKTGLSPSRKPGH